VSDSRNSRRHPSRYLPTLRGRAFFQATFVLLLVPVLVQAALFAWLCITFEQTSPSASAIALAVLLCGLGVAAAHFRVRAMHRTVHSEVMRISFEEGSSGKVDEAIDDLFRLPWKILTLEVPLALGMLLPLAALTPAMDPRLLEPVLVLPACLLFMIVTPYVQREQWEVQRLIQFMPPLTRPSKLKGHMSSRYLMGGIMILFPMGLALLEVYNAGHVLLLTQGGTSLNIIRHVDPVPVLICLVVLAVMCTLTWRAGQHMGLMLESISRYFEDAFRTRPDDEDSEPPEMKPSFIREVAELQSTAKMFGARLMEIRSTQRRKIEGLETAQRVKTVFLANMSHDLKSPLNSVIGFSELMLRGIEGEMSEGQKEDIRLIHASGEELLNLINNILDSARLEAGKLELHHEWTPSVELVTRVVKTGMPQIGTKRIEFDSEIQPGLPPVNVDPHRISQAIGNVISNAIKFMEHGKVTVRAYVHKTNDVPPRRFLRIDVEDTGSGIREEDRDRIFDAFQQIDRSYSRKSSGMGLGLTLTKRLVDLHHGHLMLTSEVGRGSTFSISLPLED
jgi:signal transduction histidine kinase